jgi:hypothetical protein
VDWYSSQVPLLARFNASHLYLRMLTKRKRFNEGLILAQSLSQTLLASISVRKKSMAAPFASRLCRSSVGPIRSMCTLPNRTSLPLRIILPCLLAMLLMLVFSEGPSGRLPL